jgi:putative flippase GtrA
VTWEPAGGTFAKHITARRALPRFLVVGLLSLAVDFGTYVACHAKLGMPVWLAAATGYCVAFGVNFGLNRTWVFPDADMAEHSRQLARYVVLVAVNLVLTTVTVPALVSAGAEYRLAKLAVAAVIAGVNFVVQRIWVFRRSPGQ